MLQRAIGNRAIAQMIYRRQIQAKLTVGVADDPYGHEILGLVAQGLGNAAIARARQAELGK